MLFDPKDLNVYPKEPGVYLMKDQNGRVLYIGKAKDLQKRLKQYFSSTSSDTRETIPYLLSQVETIETIITLTEKDALILENNLIKRDQPKYNILLKDDKTFVRLLITDHEWPMLRLIRLKGKLPTRGRFFGPYTNALAARQIFDLISRLFPLRQCSDAELKSRKRPCLLYDIHRCLAPCVKKCSQEEYQEHLKAATSLLSGQNKELLKDLHSQMKEATEKLEFERAQTIYQTIRQIEHVTSIQHVDNPQAKDCDAIGLIRRFDTVIIILLQFREGKVIGSQHFSFHLVASEDEEILESFLILHYSIHKVPREILLPMELENHLALSEILAQSAEHAVTILSPKRGKKHDLIEMARRNAAAILSREEDERSLNEKMLLDLQETLQLLRFPRWIECFDTSNISGAHPVASMCGFVNGIRDKSRTKLFRIKSIGAANDYSAMREVLHRHFLKEKEKGSFCDLLIVDGGKGQLNIALEVLQELGIATIDVIALSKEEARHDKGLTREKVYIPHQKEPIEICPRSPMLFLLQRIRDEAHRLAITYHRKCREGQTLLCELDEIEGIGPVKRQKLLQYFGSVRAIRMATKESLKNVEGLTRKDVDRIWNFIQTP